MPPRSTGSGGWPDVAREHVGVTTGAIELFVIPSFTSIPGAIDAFAGTKVAVGAQDLFWEDNGAFTGEVSGSELAELGVGVVEVGHAERRRIFNETEQIVAAKTAAALRNGIAPVLCIGEERGRLRMTRRSRASRSCGRRSTDAPAGRVIVAYEPVWAIGAAQPAEPGYIRSVCRELRGALTDLPGRDGSIVIYGGSAGPGLLGQLGADVDGIFLGRFAHEPAALISVLDEALELAR